MNPKQSFGLGSLGYISSSWGSLEPPLINNNGTEMKRNMLPSDREQRSQTESEDEDEAEAVRANFVGQLDSRDRNQSSILPSSQSFV